MLQIIDFFIHLDKYLSQLVAMAGNWSYVVLFLIIFCETGLVVMPILPGDSLLFAAGSLSALGALNLWALLIILFIAAVAGDALNYWIGREIGLKLLEGPLARFIDKKHLEKANHFYAKHGAKAIVFARFVPIMRTIAPFTAGVARMEYSRFFHYNVVGAFVWVGLFTVGGYLFGNIPIVKQNFSLVVIGIIVVSLLPTVVEAWRSRKPTVPADKMPKA